MKKGDQVYLRHILDAVLHIEKYHKEVDDYEGFCSNEMAHDAVIRQMAIIGEAAKRVSPQLRIETSNIPWDDITGMRDKLVHDYFGIDLSAVWNTAKHDIPVLKAQIEKLLQK